MGSYNILLLALIVVFKLQLLYLLTTKTYASEFFFELMNFPFFRLVILQQNYKNTALQEN